MASAQNLLGHLFLEFSLVACRLFSLTLRCALLEATFRNLFSLFLVGSKNNVSALFWLRFRMVWALYFFLFWALYFFLFSGFQKRRFGFAMARAQSLLGFCFFARASQTPFSWVWPGGLQAFSLFLVGSKSNVSAVFWLRFRMVWALFLSFFLMGSKSDVSAFFRLRFRNGLFAWLGHYFFVFSLFLVGSKSDVSAFFRLRFRNGLGTKPAGALLFRMRSRRSFLRLCLVAEVSLCLVAEVSQWLGHDSVVFRGSKSNVSRFLRLQFRNGLDAKPAGVFLSFYWVPKATFRHFSGCGFAMACSRG